MSLLEEFKREITTANEEKMCQKFEIKTIKGEKDQVIDTYCRCNDGSYGFSCNEINPNPCIGYKRFELSPDTIPNNYFIHCDNNTPFLFKCPSYLEWDDTLSTCKSNIDDKRIAKIYQNFLELYDSGKTSLPNTKSNPTDHRKLEAPIKKVK